MKKLFFAWALIVSIAGIGFSQEEEKETDKTPETSMYTFFVNFVSEDFTLPLVGFINIAKGDHDKAQLGLLNWNTGNFDGVQASLINTVGGNLSGAQIGLGNLTVGEVKGLQGSLVNIAKSVNGAQLGLLNVAKTLKGFQFGLVNYVDDIEDGIPIGLLSIVRKGGYHAVEYSFSEFHPVTLSLKIGVEKFYTNLSIGHDASNDFDWDNFAMGIGFGSILNINKSLFFNPELNYMNTTWTEENNQSVSFIPFIGFNITKNFSITAGPSFTWVRNEDCDDQDPLFALYEYEYNDENDIVIGARASLRFRF
jgi:hypothetical protein